MPSLSPSTLHTLRRSRGRRTSQIAASAEPAIRRLFLSACRAAGSAVDHRRIASTLRPPVDRDAIEAALRPSLQAFDTTMRGPLATILAATYLKTRTWAAGQLGITEPRSPGGQLAAAAADPQVEAVRWALSRAADLIGIVTDDMRENIERLVALAFAQGIPTPEVARLLNAQLGLGLSAVQMTSVLRAFSRLSLAPPGTLVTVGARRVRVPAGGWAPGDIAAQVGRYADMQRAARAQTFGRTESITAANVGQQMLWLRAVREGWLTPGTRRRWSAAPNACPICRALNGQTASLTGEFSGPDRPLPYPPAHPSCRCAVVLDL